MTLPSEILPVGKPTHFAIPRQSKEPQQIFEKVYCSPTRIHGTLFITIGPTVVGLWSSMRSMEFVEQTNGGYSHLHSWEKANWHEFKVATKSGQIDIFHITPSKCLFPLNLANGPDFSLGSPAFILEFKCSTDVFPSTPLTKEKPEELNHPEYIDGGLLVSRHPQSLTILEIKSSIDGASIYSFSHVDPNSVKVDFYSSNLKLFWKQRLAYNPIHLVLAVVNDCRVSLYRLHSTYCALVTHIEFKVTSQLSSISWSFDGSTLAILDETMGIYLADPYGNFGLAVGIDAIYSHLPSTSIQSIAWSTSNTALILLPSQPFAYQLVLIPMAKKAYPSVSPIPIYFDDSRIFVFRSSLLGFPISTLLAWEIISVPPPYLDSMKNGPIQCVSPSPNGDWIAVVGLHGLCFCQLSSRTWKLFSNSADEREFIIKKLTWFDNDHLAIVCYSLLQNRNELRIITPHHVLDHSSFIFSIQLSRRVLWLGHSEFISLLATPKENYLIVLYEDHVLHVFTISYIKKLPITTSGSRVTLEFKLNATLSAFGMETSYCASFPQYHWKVSFIPQSLFPRPINNDFLLFLRGDSLFLVQIPTMPSPISAVNAALLEPRNISNFFLYLSKKTDLWLLTLSCGSANLRQLPFNSEAELNLNFSFTPGFFLPTGVFMGIESTSDPSSALPLKLAKSIFILPVLAKFELDRGNCDAFLSYLLHLYDTTSLIEFSLAIEYILLTLIEEYNEAHLSTLHTLMQQRSSIANIYLRSLIKVARSLETSQAKWLFSKTQSVESIFDKCIANENLSLASMFLMLRLALSQSNVQDELLSLDSNPIIHLLRLSLNANDFQLVAELHRITETILDKDSCKLSEFKKLVFLRGTELMKLHHFFDFIRLAESVHCTSINSFIDDCRSSIGFNGSSISYLNELFSETSINDKVCAILHQTKRPSPSRESIKQHLLHQRRGTCAVKLADPSLDALTNMLPGELAEMEIEDDPLLPYATKTITLLKDYNQLIEAALWTIVIFYDVSILGQLSTAQLEEIERGLFNSKHLGLLELFKQVRNQPTHLFVNSDI